jgi:hypothetical protein
MRIAPRYAEEPMNKLAKDLQIAQIALALGFPSLEAPPSDSHEVTVWKLKTALETAYEAGYRAGVSAAEKVHGGKR